MTEPRAIPPLTVVYELYSGPDDHRRYHFAMLWWAEYRPGHPDGENVSGIRGQGFFADPKPYQDRHREAGINVVEIDRRGRPVDR